MNLNIYTAYNALNKRFEVIMDIYVVQSGDTINSIADNYRVSVDRLIFDNGLDNPYNLVTGQALIIAYPKLTYTVQEGDTLNSIANMYNVTIMQLLRNNSFLSNREYIYPGEILVISYSTFEDITTNGYTYAYIKNETLIKTLPYLTYLSIFNYGISEAGEITTYSNDANIIQLSKDYGVAPLLMVSSLSPTGESDVELLYQILLNEEYNNKLLNNILNILRSSAYYGVNIMISNLNTINQNLYLNLLEKASQLFRAEGYFFIITINPNIQLINGQVTFEQIDYYKISQLVDRITFLQYAWGTNPGPPSPISSSYLIRNFINYVTTFTPPEKIIVGKPLIGYDWELPYVPNKTIAKSLTLDAAVTLAYEVGAVILFDEISETPYFQYTSSYIGSPIEHIVWFIDIRSINALTHIIDEYNLSGSGIWNIMVFYQQLWTFLNSNYNIIKILPTIF
jgi:spore germination protein